MAEEQTNASTVFGALDENDRVAFMVENHLQYNSSSGSEVDKAETEDDKAAIRDRRRRHREMIEARRAERRAAKGKPPRKQRGHKEEEEDGSDRGEGKGGRRGKGGKDSGSDDEGEKRGGGRGGKGKENRRGDNDKEEGQQGGGEQTPRRQHQQTPRNNRQDQAIRLVSDNRPNSSWQAGPMNVASTLPRSEEDLKIWFDKLDADGSGAIEKHEFKKLYESMEHFGAPVNSKRLDEKMAKMTRVDGRLTFDEFVILIMEFVKA